MEHTTRRLTDSTARGQVSVEHCGRNIVSNHNWRCTAEKPTDDAWASSSYQEDATWEVPAHGGKNGVAPWGHISGMDTPSNNAPSVPSWIWTADFQGTDEVWCRYDANYDGAHVQAANGLGNGGWGQGHICADDSFTLFINGEQIVQSSNWQVGLGHIAALHHHPSTSYQIHSDIGTFFSEAAMRPDPTGRTRRPSPSAGTPARSGTPSPATRTTSTPSRPLTPAAALASSATSRTAAARSRPSRPAGGAPPSAPMARGRADREFIRMPLRTCHAWFFI
jgi:hypothetical protein